MSVITKIKSNQMIKAGAWNVIANFLVKGITVLTIPLFTRLLSTAEYGEVATFLSYGAILAILIGGNLYGSINNARIDYADDFDGYLSSIISLSMISFAVFMVLGVLFRNPVSSILKMDVKNFFLLLTYSFSVYVISFYQTKNMADFKYKRNVLVSFVTTCGNIVFSILFICVVFEQDKVFARNLGTTITNAVIALFVCIFIVVHGKKICNKVYWKYALKISLPNIVHLLSQNILAQFDRIFIKQLCGAAETGTYSLVYNFGLIVNLLWAGINGAWGPWLYRKLQEHSENEIVKKSKIYVSLFSVMTIIIIMLAPTAVRLFTPKEYWSGISMVIPITLSSYFICLYSFPVNLEFFYKKNMYIASGTTAAAIINLVTNAIYIPQYGYQAAAYTTLISYVFLFVFHWIIVEFILKINIYKMSFFLKEIIVTITASFLLYYPSPSLLKSVCVIISVSVFYSLQIKKILQS